MINLYIVETATGVPPQITLLVIADSKEKAKEIFWQVFKIQIPGNLPLKATIVPENFWKL